MSIKNQKGVILYLSLIIMTILLSIALGLATIFIGQVEIMRGMGNSVIAFHAANTGIEKVLVDRENPNLAQDHYSGFLANGSSYEVIVISGADPDCPAANFCIRSIGSYQGARRAIEIFY